MCLFYQNTRVSGKTQRLRGKLIREAYLETGISIYPDWRWLEQLGHNVIPLALS